MATVGLKRQHIVSLCGGIYGTTASIGGAPRPCRQLLQTGKPDKCRLNFHIVQRHIVVGQIERLADHDATLFARL